MRWCHSVFISGILMACYMDAMGERETYISGGRIVGGEIADQEEYPFIVSIQKINNGVWMHTCGGSIVSPKVILTACHCLAFTTEKPLKLKPYANYRIVAGVSNWKENSTGRQEIPASEFVVHPSCSRKLWFTKSQHSFYDAGLIMLKSPLKYSAEVKPLKLFSRNPVEAVAELRKLQEQNAVCYTPGWGRVQQYPKIVRSPVLKVASQKMLKGEVCYQKTCRALAVKPGKCPNVNDFEQLCTTSDSGSICKGDSGGPLVCNGFVFGLSSQVGVKCEINGQEIFTGIKSILDLINKYT